MKKINYIFLILLSIFLLGGCSFNRDNLEDAKIYVTNYPVKYLLDTFYKDHATIESIYPSDADTTTYQLTDKQIKDYSKGQMFVYNGLTEEKKLAKEFISKNDNLLIMDVSYGLSLQYSLEELWLSPNNYLMLAKNVRDNFREYLTNKTIKEEIENRYNDLAEKVSIMDADLRSIGKQAKAKNKALIVGSSKAYKYLENYGFTTVCLDDDTYKDETAIKTLKNNFKNNKYSVLIYDPDDASDLVQSLISDTKANNIKLSKMTYGISDEDYIGTMQIFIDSLRNATTN